ncbi:MAG: OmpP1/FadL family transporter [Panacagrimonas sp.]
MCPSHRLGLLRMLALLALVVTASVHAGGGYFVLGYGPLAHQSAGTSTAIGLDAFAGASNPGKLFAAGDRLDLGLLTFMPHRRIERTGSNNSIYDLTSTSENTRFFLPEAAYARRINEKWSWGVSLYGNGGLNTEYQDDTGIPDTNFNPAKCGSRPGNFFFGCGKAGFDLAQVIVAPTLSWQFAPGHSFGVAPLLAYQQISIYGLQAFEAVSAHPDAVSNQGYDSAFGAGVRVGWYGQIKPWLNLGAAYSTRIYMQKFEEYEGILADGGSFDIPANFSVGVGFMPTSKWVVGIDIQRINFGEIRALGNGVLNSLGDPATNPPPLGSPNGSGFNWRNLTNYRLGVSYAPITRLTLRAGFLYGKRAQADASANSVTFNLFAPNPIRSVTAGFTWALNDKSDLQFAYGRYLKGTYKGPSATAGLGIGGEESVTPFVDTIWLGWSRRL